MLNKDEYDPKEYDDYYERETRGAEILGGNRDDGSGVQSFFIGLTLLTILSVGGYFGYNHMVNLGDREFREVTTPADENITLAVQKRVQNIISIQNVDGKISPEDIANIVQLVMDKMKEENELYGDDNRDIKTEDMATSGESTDEQLYNNLYPISADVIEEKRGDIDNNLVKPDRVISNDGEIEDTYNKVVVKNGGQDELGMISRNISKMVSSENREADEYEKQLQQESEHRKREMRYVIVKKGDTLGKIAKRVYGNVMAYKKIYRANPDILKRPDKIFIGQKLRVPE